jgi:uncharacterized protein (DUF362 family)
VGLRLIAASRLAWRRRLTANLRSRVYLDHVSADGTNYLEAIQQGLAYIGFGSDLPRRPRVFIKPNLTFPTFRPGVMTSPEVIAAAITALADYSADVWVGDSDSGGYNPFRMEDVYRSTGIWDLASRFGAHVVNLSRLERKSVDIEVNKRRIVVDLPRLLTDEMDLLITMPVPKIHMNTGVSLTFKNQWGCIPEPDDRLRLHPHFKEVVVAVNKLVKAGTSIIDGRFGLNGSGPMLGKVEKLGWLCVADSIGAGARVCCDLMQVDINIVRHLRYAASLGLIPESSEIDYNTELTPFIGPRFFLRRAWTDVPGYLAFNSSALTNLAYFSRWAEPLHWLLYRFRQPFYDYPSKRVDRKPIPPDERDQDNRDRL